MRQRTNKVISIALVLCVICLSSCARRTTGTFRLLPTTPQYVVESPDRARTPYSEVLETFTPHGRGWVELKPGMGLYIQNVIFREASSRRDIANFVGTETMRYTVDKRGSLVEFEQAVRVTPRPQETPPVDELLPDRQRRRKYHRFFYQVLVIDTNLVAVVASSDSLERIQSLTEMIQSGAASLAEVAPVDFTMFPDTASVAVEMVITVDGEPTRVSWGQRLSNVAGSSPHPKLFRLHRGKWLEVEFDPADRDFLAVPLLPGDRIEL